MLMFTDIDNTVLYSHRHPIAEPVIWVESLNGHPQSFVSERVFDFFRSQNWLEVVPITTRTERQYDRLKEIFQVFGWENALICNGSLLFRNGVEDPAWTEESRALAEPDRFAYEAAYELALKIAAAASIVAVDPFLFYVKTDDVPAVFSILSSQADNAHLSVLKDSRKVYCIPKSLNKGRAAERYINRFGYRSYIAAGDSDFDIPMLQQAAVCLCPEHISEFDTKGKKRLCTGLFSDKICDELEMLRQEG